VSAGVIGQRGEEPQAAAVDGREEAAAEVDRASRTPLTVEADDLTAAQTQTDCGSGKFATFTRKGWRTPRPGKASMCAPQPKGHLGS
jgi:hypothetical protein